MTPTTHQTEITADPALPTITITREFDAPPERVFRAHVDPDLLVRWLGPRSLTMRIDDFDPRTGGHWAYTHTDDDGDYGFYGSFHEIRENERIVQTFTFTGFPDSVSLETATFETLPAGRSRIVATSVFNSLEARDGMLASGMEVGVVEGYERLDDVLTG